MLAAHEAIDARAGEARKAFLLHMNAELQRIQDEHSAACDALLARWREDTRDGELDSDEGAFDAESARLLARADARLDALQRESEREHARIAQERAEALRALEPAPPKKKETRAERFRRRQAMKAALS